MKATSKESHYFTADPELKDSKSQFDAWRAIILRKRGKTIAQTPRKTQKTQRSTNPSFRKCNSDECQGSTPIHEECFFNLITSHSDSEAKFDSKVFDDKVKKAQLNKWRLHRKKMIRQSKRHSSLKEHEKLILSSINNDERNDSDCQSTSAETRHTSNNNEKSSTQFFSSLLNQLGLDKLFFSNGTYHDDRRNSYETDSGNSSYASLNDIISGVLDIKF